MPEQANDKQTQPPRIETVEGIGADFLVWVRREILALRERVEELENQEEARY